MWGGSMDRYSALAAFRQLSEERLVYTEFRTRAFQASTKVERNVLMKRDRMGLATSER